MMSIRNWLAAVFLCGLFVLSSTASAYVTIRGEYNQHLIWGDGQIPWYLDSAGSDDLSSTQVVDALTAAFNAWSQPECSGLSFVYQGTADGEVFGALYVRFDEDDFGHASEHALAYAGPSNFNPDGTVHSGLMVFNGRDYTWTDIAVTGQGTLSDLQAVATHEVGHVLGLHHSRDKDATMFFSGGSMTARSLSQDDINGVCFLYPASEFAKGSVCDSCDDDSDCAQGDCIDHPWENGRFCGQACTYTSQCPNGFVCDNQGQCAPEYDYCSQAGGNIPFGSYCWGNETCESGICIAYGSTLFCSALCTQGCPDGANCLAGQVCAPVECNPIWDSGCPSDRACIWQTVTPSQPGGDTVGGLCVSLNGGSGVGEACGGILQGCSPELYCWREEGQEEGVCLRDCRRQTQEGCTPEEYCLDLEDLENPARGVCVPKAEPTPVPDVTTSDVGAGEDVNVELDDLGSDVGVQLPPPPNTDDKPHEGTTGGCRSGGEEQTSFGVWLLLLCTAIRFSRRREEGQALCVSVFDRAR